MLCSILGSSQEYEFRVYIGQNYYQGDLSPLRGNLSLSPGRMALGGLAGIRLNKYFTLNSKFIIGQLGGSDDDSKESSRRERNLSFDSPLYEIGLNTELKLNHFFPFLSKYGLNVYYTTGVNLFHFNPKALSKIDQFGKREFVDLQPLGTEGQGLPGYKEKYSLTQINIPFGLGVKFHLFDKVEAGIEVVPRLTFTDYIDDVSGEYVPYDELIAANRPETAVFANRTGEFYNSGPVKTSPGALRGNPENNDWYLFTGIYISYNFGSGYVPLKFNQKKDTSEKQVKLPLGL